MGNIELRGDFLVRQFVTQRANGSDVCLGELGCANGRAFRLSILADHIRRVISGGADEEMRGIDARSIVTAVTNIKAAWDWAVGSFVGDAMRLCLPVVVIRDDAVTTVVNGASPQPAGIRIAWRVAVEKPLGQWACARCIRAGAGTEPRRAFTDWAQVAM